METNDLFQVFRRFDVIDGQQPLTTTLILLREIISQIKSINNEAFRRNASRLEEAFLKQGTHYKLNSLGDDKEFLRHFVIDDKESLAPETIDGYMATPTGPGSRPERENRQRTRLARIRGRTAGRDRERAYICLSLGSRRSRDQSPRKLKASTARNSATPGKKVIHQALPM